MAVYEVPRYFIDENKTAFMLQLGDIESVSHDSMQREWKFDNMIDSKTFFSIPNWLGLEGRRLPVIATGRKSACWHCRVQEMAGRGKSVGLLPGSSRSARLSPGREQPGHP